MSKKRLGLIFLIMSLTGLSVPVKSMLGSEGNEMPSVESAYTAANYIQDGLFRQVDSFENLGYGMHTDNPVAWHDLVQDDDWNIHGATYRDGMFIKEDTSTLPIQVALTQAQVNDLRTNGGTMEIVVKPEIEMNTGNCCLFSIGWSGSLSLFSNVGYKRFGLGGYQLEYAIQNFYILPYSPTTVFTVVADSEGTRIYKDSVLIGQTEDYTSLDIASNFASWNATIGLSGNGRCQAAYPNWSTIATGFGYFSCRIYNRPLDEDEIVYNYMVDKARFGL